MTKTSPPAPSVAHSYTFTVSCPKCSGPLEELSTEETTENIRRARLHCDSCEATYRITVTLLRTWTT